MILRRSIVVLLLAILASTDARAQDAAPAVAVDAGVADAAPAPAPVDAGPDGGVDGGVAPVRGGTLDLDGDGKDDATVVAEERTVALEWDADGDGALDAVEVELERQAAEVFADVPAEVVPEALDARPERNQLGVRSLTVAQFRAMVKVTRHKVLDRLSARIARQSAGRMETVSRTLAVCSLSGLLLLLLPLLLARRYPGRFGVLTRYSVLAALTFMLTVASFGAVALIQRGAQSALSEYTNPELALASGFFDTLHDDAAEHVVIGKELFAPTLVQLQGATDAQPSVVLIANGRKLVKDASVFVRVARALEWVAVVASVVPTVLLVLSMGLFLLAIRPTLVAIVELPAQAAAGDPSGGDVFRRSMGRVGNELLATLGSLMVLVVISVLAGIALGRVVQPALATLISYFTIAVMYLRFVEDASSALVMVMMFSVILFLLLNLAVIVLATTFFVAKTQRIFQQRFADKVPLTVHRRFWIWGSTAVLWTMLLPLIYMFVARAGIGAINTQVMASARDPDAVNWTALMLAGPLLLVVGFIVALWASRAFAAIRFLIAYNAQGGSSAAVLGVVDSAATTFARP